MRTPIHHFLALLALTGAGTVEEIYTSIASSQVMLTKLIRGADHRGAPGLTCCAPLCWDTTSSRAPSLVPTSISRIYGDTKTFRARHTESINTAKRRLVKISSYYHTDFRRFVLSYMAMLMLLKRSYQILPFSLLTCKTVSLLLLWIHNRMGR